MFVFALVCFVVVVCVRVLCCFSRLFRVGWCCLFVFCVCAGVVLVLVCVWSVCVLCLVL